MSGKNAIQTPRRQLWLNARMTTKNARRELNLAWSPMISGKHAIPTPRNNHWLTARRMMMNAKREAMKPC